MAKVIRFHRTGGPEVLQFEELEIPEPGPDEVKIKVEAIGLNRAELAYRSGRYLERPKLPARLGYEAAGSVVSVGSSVKGIRSQDRVSVIPAFSMNDYGTYGEEIIVPAAATVLDPAGLTSQTSAAMWMQYLTAYGGLIDIGALKTGDYALITAASSSVGLAAIQIARMLGAIPIAATRTGAKTEALLKAGAAHVIATEQQDLVAEMNTLTGKAGARVIFDSVAGPFVETLTKTAAPRATIIIYGGLSAKPTPFPGGLAMARGLAFRGYTLFEITRDAVRLARAKEFILDGIVSGQLRPIIDRIFPFEQAVAAHTYIESGDQVGKVMLSVTR
jgi:NADPH:quinone reductase-like Zn-dependent oxidoreductase